MVSYPVLQCVRTLNFLYVLGGSPCVPGGLVV
jgi:hypothetical protein